MTNINIFSRATPSFSVDLADAPGPEVRVSVGEHLEAGRVLPAQGAVRGPARGTAARSLGEVRHHVARTRQRLRRLPLYQKVRVRI